jgi:hypothetical protein
MPERTDTPENALRLLAEKFGIPRLRKALESLAASTAESRAAHDSGIHRGLALGFHGNPMNLLGATENYRQPDFRSPAPNPHGTVTKKNPMGC